MYTKKPMILCSMFILIIPLISEASTSPEDIKAKDKSGNNTLKVTPSSNKFKINTDVSNKKNIESKRLNNKSLVKNKVIEVTSAIQAGEVIIENTKTLIAPHKHEAERPWFYFWAVLFFGFISIVLNIYQHRSNKNNKKIEIINEYWIKNIAMPVCIEPLVVFIERFANDLEVLNDADKSDLKRHAEKLREYLDNFQYEKNSIVKKFYILSVKWNGLYTVLSQHLDDLDDDVAQHCFVNGLSSSIVTEGDLDKHSIDEGVFYTKLGEMISVLSEFNVSEM